MEYQIPVASIQSMMKRPTCGVDNCVVHTTRFAIITGRLRAGSATWFVNGERLNEPA